MSKELTKLQRSMLSQHFGSVEEQLRALINSGTPKAKLSRTGGLKLDGSFFDEVLVAGVPVVQIVSRLVNGVFETKVSTVGREGS